jgi:hypothetical protein
MRRDGGDTRAGQRRKRASHVDTKTGDFEPGKFEDQYEGAVKELLKRKHEVPEDRGSRGARSRQGQSIHLSPGACLFGPPGQLLKVTVADLAKTGLDEPAVIDHAIKMLSAGGVVTFTHPATYL